MADTARLNFVKLNLYVLSTIFKTLNRSIKTYYMEDIAALLVTIH